MFLEELSDVARRHPWVVLFFDTYERTGPMLDTWLRDVLVSERYGELPANVLVTLAGQSRLAARCWEDWHDLVTDWPLEVFTDAEAHQLLAGKGVTDERVVEVILRLSGRLPVLVSTLAESQPGSVEEIGDPSGTAVERFLKWEADPARRAAALACAFPQELDEDVFRAAVEEEAAELFGWLRSMPFVTDRSGHCRYHEVVRGAMLRLQRRQSPARWEQLHTRLADAFGRRRARLEEAAAPADGWWEDERWRGYRLQETYHRLCADARAALPAALRELIDAYDHGTISLRRWAQTLITAGRDCDEPAVTGWGEQVMESLGEEPHDEIAVLTLLLARAGLDPTGQSLALTLRGRNHRNAESYPQALADYEQALALDPENEHAHFGRGRTRHLTGRLDEAIADYTRAVELAPEDLMNVSYRGLALQVTERYEEAIADFDRSLELKSDYEWALTSRGATLRLMGRYEEALADFNRAIDIDPAYSWALARRSDLYGDLDRYGEAEADFTRAIALHPDYGWALTHRGMTRAMLDRHEEAVADYDAAIGLDPDDRWALSHRAMSHRMSGRCEQALADLNRAVEIDPDAPWSLTRRGLLHRLLGHHEAAPADLTRALTLEPGSAWAHYETAVVLHAQRNPDRDGHLIRVVELRTPEAAEETPDPADVGNLLLAHYLWDRREAAERHLARFLGTSPPPGQLHELLLALRSLLPLVPAAEPWISEFCRTVEAARPASV
ncbi:tetratricopeptide repeat protein [Streptomyces goshikiensis]|uniref:tetratricopeptide repeat protein n=1 Tax=Streptomyces goshikiensis TaxID=1942 RepID=UPI003719CBD5